ncbi:MAG: ANTAR domain-containing protein [Actinomycetota bacterium]
MDLETQVAQLHEALESRDLIGQAMGILIERDALSPQEALDQLKVASQRSNVRLREIAREVVDRAVQRPRR